MLQSIAEGLTLLFQWPTPMFLVGGILLGIWLGAVPGLGGVTGLVLILPFTFGMEPAQAFALLLGMFAPITTSDTLSSVMLGTPGTAGSQSTILDGYPLAQKGHGERALGAAYTVSAVGGVIGGLTLLLFLPIAMPIILALGTPDFFLLALLGLLMVGSISGGSLARGVGAAAIGLLLSQVGFPVSSPEPRYWFNMVYLMDGLPLVPVILGLFGVAEMLRLAVRNTSISSVPREKAEGGGLRDGIRDAYIHRWLALRCALLGTYIGMLPGLGNAIADWIAYGHAVQSAKDKSQFGKGDIRGVIAPESTNNAVIGAALIPTLTLGIPGTGAMAILLGALLIHGLTPGQMMLTTELPLTVSMVFTIIIANVLAAGLLMLWGRYFAKAAFISGHLIVPAVLVFLLMGSWLWAADMPSWYFLLGFGVLGWFMTQSGWPRPPLVLGFVLGPIMEQSGSLAVQSYTLAEFVSRPQSMILLGAVVLFLAYTVYRAIQAARQSKHAEEVHPSQRDADRSPLLSAAFTLSMIVLFAWALVQALDWSFFSRTFPLVITATGLSAFSYQLVRDLLRIHAGHTEVRIEAPLKTALYFALLLALVIVTPWIGQVAALVGFVVVYLLCFASFPLWGVAAYGLGTFAVLWFGYRDGLGVHFLSAGVFG